ncbi:MAG: hypothetical protein FWD89_00935 [Firmicutes bacterium]|nr:hypothetical protein [Bacillota bacterium]
MPEFLEGFDIGNIGLFISLGISAVFVLYVVTGFLLGLFRGLKKSVWRVGMLIVAGVVAAVVAPMFIPMIMNINLPFEPINGSLADFVTKTINTNIPDELPITANDMANTVGVLIAALSAVVSVILFVVFYYILKALSWPFFAIFVRNKKGAKKRRLFGGLVGIVGGMVTCLVLFIPLSGIFGIAQAVVTPSKPDAPTIVSILPMDEEFVDMIDGITGAYKGSAAVAFMGLDNIAFSAITTVNASVADGKTTKVNGNDELLGFIKLFNDIVAVPGFADLLSEMLAVGDANMEGAIAPLDGSIEPPNEGGLNLDDILEYVTVDSIMSVVELLADFIFDNLITRAILIDGSNIGAVAAIDAIEGEGGLALPFSADAVAYAATQQQRKPSTVFTFEYMNTNNRWATDKAKFTSGFRFIVEEGFEILEVIDLDEMDFENWTDLLKSFSYTPATATEERSGVSFANFGKGLDRLLGMDLLKVIGGLGVELVSYEVADMDIFYIEDTDAFISANIDEIFQDAKFFENIFGIVDALLHPEVIDFIELLMPEMGENLTAGMILDEEIDVAFVFEKIMAVLPDETDFLGRMLLLAVNGFEIDAEVKKDDLTTTYSATQTRQEVGRGVEAIFMIIAELAEKEGGKTQEISLETLPDILMGALDFESILDPEAIMTGTVDLSMFDIIVDLGGALDRMLGMQTYITKAAYDALTEPEKNALVIRKTDFSKEIGKETEVVGYWVMRQATNKNNNLFYNLTFNLVEGMLDDMEGMDALGDFVDIKALLGDVRTTGFEGLFGVIHDAVEVFVELGKIMDDIGGMFEGEDGFDFDFSDIPGLLGDLGGILENFGNIINKLPSMGDMIVGMIDEFDLPEEFADLIKDLTELPGGLGNALIAEGQTITALMGTDGLFNNVPSSSAGDAEWAAEIMGVLEGSPMIGAMMLDMMADEVEKLYPGEELGELTPIHQAVVFRQVSLLLGLF